MIIAGNKIYHQCSNCDKLVQLNKRVFGSLHICLTDEEINKKCVAMEAKK